MSIFVNNQYILIHIAYYYDQVCYQNNDINCNEDTNFLRNIAVDSKHIYM